ncbi:acetolactate synthase 2 small subunit [Colwelliaceae bacterium BS250]|jgi:acetolactate synthase II small subunit
MQQYRLTIIAQQQPVLMERILQVVRYRGFSAKSLSMLPAKDNKVVIEVSVEGDKSVDNLQKQLLKIIDIEQIKAEDQLKQKITA